MGKLNYGMFSLECDRIRTGYLHHSWYREGHDLDSVIKDLVAWLALPYHRKFAGIDLMYSTERKGLIAKVLISDEGAALCLAAAEVQRFLSQYKQIEVVEFFPANCTTSFHLFVTANGMPYERD